MVRAKHLTKKSRQSKTDKVSYFFYCRQRRADAKPFLGVGKVPKFPFASEKYLATLLQNLNLCFLEEAKFHRIFLEFFYYRQRRSDVKLFFEVGKVPKFSLISEKLPRDFIAKFGIISWKEQNLIRILLEFRFSFTS